MLERDKILESIWVRKKKLKSEFWRDNVKGGTRNNVTKKKFWTGSYIIEFGKKKGF